MNTTKLILVLIFTITCGLLMGCKENQPNQPIPKTNEQIEADHQATKGKFEKVDDLKVPTFTQPGRQQK